MVHVEILALHCYFMILQVHLLCLLVRCQYLNQLCQEETLQAQALSVTLVTKELKVPSPQTCTVDHVSQVLTWIKLKKQYLVGSDL
jgi:hypothetical protein